MACSKLPTYPIRNVSAAFLRSTAVTSSVRCARCPSSGSTWTMPSAIVAASNAAQRRWCSTSIANLELVQTHRLAQLMPQDIGPSHVHSAIEIFSDLEKLMLPKEQISAVAQQLTRVLMSYQGWQLPVALRDDLLGGPALWHFGIPAPGAAAGGAQLLPLASDEPAFSRLSGNRPSDGEKSGVVKTITSGADAILNYVPANGRSRIEGLALYSGEDKQLVLGKEHMSMLHMWRASLRLEAMLFEHIDSSGNVPTASKELSDLLAADVKLYFVRMGDQADLARDNEGRNIIVLTSNDAAALAAYAYGRQQVRSVTPQELLWMARGAGDDFGFALTIGPDQASTPVGPGGKTHIPKWRNLCVTASWLAEALEQSGVEPQQMLS